MSSLDDDDIDSTIYGADIILGKNHCSWCKDPAPDGGPLKRCRGCNISIYCGRECQTAAWPTHKPLCRDRNALEPRTDTAGYETPVGLGEAMKEWAELHKYSLTVLVHAFLRLVGGVQANLRLGRVVIFHMSTERPANSPPNDNPAVKFRLADTSVINAEQAPWLRDHRQHSDAALRDPAGFCGDAANAAAAGLLPIVCLAQGTTFVAASHFAVYRAVRHRDDAPLDAETTATFRDVTRLFTMFINDGVVFRSPSPPAERSAPPVPGNMVRTRRGWKWREIQAPLGMVLLGVILRMEGFPVLETTLSVTEIWTRFWRW